MSIWLDIVGSYIVGALLLLNVMRLNASLVEQGYRSGLRYETQLSAAVATDVLEHDIRKAGYGVADTAFTVADTAQLRFLADLGADGTVDTVHISVGTPAQAVSSPNPRDRPLLRTINGGNPQEIAAGVSTFSFSYFDEDGASLNMPVSLGDIRRVRLNFNVESAIPLDGTYPVSFVELDLVPKNL